MPDTSSLGPSTLRPVTPGGIIARNLDRLRERAELMATLDPSFLELLGETAGLANGLEAYLAACSSAESSVLRDLAADTVSRNWTELYETGSTSIPLEAEMVSGHVEGRFLNVLVHATRAMRILEIGLFTGYSALAMAEALPDDGVLVACEIDPYAAAFARRWFDRSPHGRKISIEIGPAMESLERMRDAGERFDLVFVDADKARYAAYFDLVVGSSLLAPHGLLCVDNTLMQGEPYRSEARTANGRAIAEFNRIVADDARVEQVLLPVRDGLTLIRRASA